MDQQPDFDAFITIGLESTTISRLAGTKNKLHRAMFRVMALRPRRFRRHGRKVGMSAKAEHQESKVEDQPFTDYLLTGPGLSDFDLTRSVPDA